VVMSRIPALDEITRSLGPPALLRWVDAPFGAAAAIIRIRHRGSAISLSPSGSFRLIFHLSSSEVVRDNINGPGSRQFARQGSIVTSFTRSPERIRILGAADTLHLLFSPELTSACASAPSALSPRTSAAMQAAAARMLVDASLHGSATRLEQTVASIARTLVEHPREPSRKAGGLTPQAGVALQRLLQHRLDRSIPVSELAEAAGLSLHHFIRACRQSEGFTPHAMVLQRRIDWAIHLLLSSSSGIDEIALRTGFSSPSHFVSTFRRMVGVTPAKLRRAAAA
jgi:AraC family transcriptional regulator